MKKFLSSLLALTMILSLVIVPANAATTDGAAGAITITRSPASGTIKQGDTVTFSATATVTPKDGSATAATMSAVNWSVSGTGSTGTPSGNDYVVTVGSAAFTVTCTANLSVGSGDDTVTVDSVSSTTDQIAVLSNQEAFEAAVKQATVTFKGRTYSANSGTTTFAIDLFGSETLPTSGTDMPTISVSDPYKSTTLVYTNSKWVAQYGTGGSALSCDVTLNATKVSPDPTVSISNNLPVNTKAISGQKVSLTADYSRKVPGKNITYAWSASNGAEISGNGASATWTPKSAGANQTVTVIVYEGRSEAARYAATYDVDADNNEIKAIDNKTSYTVSSTTPITIPAPALYDKTTGNRVTDASISVSWEDYNSRYISTRQSGNDLVVTGLRTNDSGVKVTATITYKTKTYSIDYTVYVSALDGKLDEVVNGSSLNFDLGDLEKLAENAVYKVDKTNVTIKSVRILTLPTSSDGVVYSNSRLSSKVSVPYTVGSSDELYFDAADGFLGTASMTIEATDSRNNRYNVTVNIPVVGDKTWQVCHVHQQRL